MRFSKALIKTYKESPKEAEATSHKLMLRASMIKQVSKGNYTYLPLGLKALRKVEKIVREEMNKAGAVELLMPIMQTADLWIESGRWHHYGPELMRFKDRNEREFVLGPTHEEVSVFIFKDMIKSYKELPINMYQIQTKFRDEIRPRFGLMRGREFLMKDAYSYHLTQESLDKEYLNMKNAYTKIFERCGLNFRAVEADTGSIGGAESHEFMVLASAGEDDILFSTESDYAANIEKAKSIIPKLLSNENELEITEVHTPNIKTIEELSSFFNIPKEKTLKAILFKELEEKETNYYLAIIRGDLEINPIKVKNSFSLSMELELAEDEDITKLGLKKGFVGADNNIPKEIKIVMDESVKDMKNFIMGANKTDYHFKNANIKDLRYDIISDIRLAKKGDISPDNKGILDIARGIEVGHIFKLGTKYSNAMDAKVLDENGRLQTVLMGCYGIGVSRVIAAAVEQSNDENGIIWPISIAPYVVDIIATNIKDKNIVTLSEKIYTELLEKGVDVIYDDRNEKAGFKFKDADLIGFPYKIIVGKKAEEGIVEIKSRKDNSSFEMTYEEAINFVYNL